MSDTVLNWALEIESAIHAIPSLDSSQEPTQVYVLSMIDAVNCFDRIQQCQVLDQTLKFGFAPTPSECLLISTPGFRRSSRSRAGLTSSATALGWESPRGKRMPVQSCNVFVDSWSKLTQRVNVIPSVFLDDRKVSACIQQSLAQVWMMSQEWGADLGWRSHRQKTCLASAPLPPPQSTFGLIPKSTFRRSPASKPWAMTCLFATKALE